MAGCSCFLKASSLCGCCFNPVGRAWEEAFFFFFLWQRSFVPSLLIFLFISTPFFLRLYHRSPLWFVPWSSWYRSRESIRRSVSTTRPCTEEYTFYWRAEARFHLCVCRLLITVNSDDVYCYVFFILWTTLHSAQPWNLICRATTFSVVKVLITAALCEMDVACYKPLFIQL